MGEVAVRFSFRWQKLMLKLLFDTVFKKVEEISDVSCSSSAETSVKYSYKRRNVWYKTHPCSVIARVSLIQQMDT